MFRNKHPQYTNVSDKTLLPAVLKKYPQYKNSISDLDKESFFNILPGIPEFVRQGYNISIAGMAQQLATGSVPFDLSTADDTTLEKIGSGIVSILLDSWAFIGGGVVGGLAGRTALKQAVKVGTKNLMKAGVKQATAKKVLLKSIESGSAFAAHTVFTSPLSQQISSGQVKPSKVGADILKSTALGGAMGTVGVAAAGLSLIPRLSAEIGTLTGVSTGLEGRLPTKEDLIHSTGFLLGLKGVKGIQRGVGRKLTGQPFLVPTKPFKQVRFPEEAAEASARVRQQQLILQSEEVIGTTFKAKPSFQVPKKYNNNFNKAWNSIPDDIRKDINVKSIREVSFNLEHEGSGGKIVIDGKNKHHILIEKGEKDIVGTFKHELLHSAVLNTKDPGLLKIIKRGGYFGHENAVRFLEKQIKIKIPTTRTGISVEDKTFAEQYPDVHQMVLKKYNVKDLSELSPQQKTEATTNLYNKAFIKDYTKIMTETGFQVRNDLKSGFLEDLLPKRFRGWVDFLKQKQDRTLSDGGKILNEFERKFVAVNDALYAGSMADFNNVKLPAFFGKFKKGHSLLGFGKEKTKHAEILTDLVRDGKMPRITKIFTDIYNAAAEVMPGLKPFQKNYLKRMYRKDILDNLIENFAALSPRTLDRLAEKKLPKRGTDEHKELTRAIEEVIPRWRTITPKKYKGFDAKTLFDIVTKINKGDVVKTTQELMRHSMGSLFRPSSSLDFSRTVPDVPKEFLENDFRVIMQSYVADTSNRIAQAQVFGAKGEIADALLRASKAENVGDFDVVSKTYRYTLGLDNTNFLSRFSPMAKRALDNMMALNVGFKIATMFATIPNLTQSFISSITVRGITPFIKGINSLIRNPDMVLPSGDTVPFREFIVRSGATDYNLAKEFLGWSGISGVSQKLAKIMTKVSGFEGVNKMNQFMSAATSYYATKTLHKRAQGRGILAKHAQEKLNSIGIDYKKPLTEKMQLETMRTFAVDSQLQKNVLRDIMLLNDPNWRPLMLFKSFGLRQYQFIKDELKFDLSRGNFMPVIRLAAFGYFGGMFVDKARHWLKELYAGEDIYKKEADGIEEFIEYIAQVGAFGVLGDMVSAENAMQSLVFFAKPVIISDAENVSKTMIALMRDTGTYGLMGAIARAPKGIAPLAGTAGRSAVRAEQISFPFTDFTIKIPEPLRLMPKGQKADAIKAHRSFVLRKIRKNILEGKSVQARKNIRSWNRANPQLPITFDDVSYKKMYEFMLRKYEKRANP